MKLLSREEFKKKVFARSKGKCVFCDGARLVGPLINDDGCRKALIHGKVLQLFLSF